jgi:predicted GNAT family N-acyltransferase
VIYNESILKISDSWGLAVDVSKLAIAKRHLTPWSESIGDDLADRIEITQGLADDSPARSIRKTVFIDEQQMPERFDETDEVALHSVLYRDGVPIATGRAYEEHQGCGVYHLGRFAVLKEYRGQDVGSAVLAALEAAAHERGATGFVLNAQVAASGFYLKHGYTQVGDVYGIGGAPHIDMSKSVRVD